MVARNNHSVHAENLMAEIAQVVDLEKHRKPKVFETLPLEWAPVNGSSALA